MTGKVYTKDDITMVFTVGANRIVSFIKGKDDFQMTEHVDKRRKTADLAPVLPRDYVSLDEMIGIVKDLSLIDDVSVELFFKGSNNRVVIYNGGKSFSVAEASMNKNWKFDWNEFMKNGLKMPE